MQTRAVTRIADLVDGHDAVVLDRRSLTNLGIGRDRLQAQLDAGRWRLVGTAVVRHNTELTREQRRRVALINCGPRAALTAFTAAEVLGLRGWERDTVHVLVPMGVTAPGLSEVKVRLHRRRHPVAGELLLARTCHAVAPATLLACATLPARAACGMAAAVVQQRLVSPQQLLAALARAPRIKHRRLLIATAHDIAMGAQALSEIDLGRLCRRAGLPQPERQAVRRDPSGRRRYLDALWELGDGRTVVVEVDGALHLRVRDWWSDQLRQNEIALRGHTVLRFPSALIRIDPLAVVGQLRRALG